MAAPCEIRMEGDTVRVVPRGKFRFLAMSRGIEFPLAAIDTVEPVGAEETEEFRGIRPFAQKVGSRVPGRLLAGRFKPWGRGDNAIVSWWLVTDPARAIVIRLHGHKYDRVIVDVDDRAATIALLQR